MVAAADWAQLAAVRERAREHRAEGLMLKELDSAVRLGRVRGAWWKWKIDPYTVDAVMVYAQAGHGRRASLFTDYTFAVWDDDELVPFAKAYSGLDDAEIREVDNWVRSHTLERFGPVRRVAPGAGVRAGLRRACRCRRGTRAASPSAFRASRAGAATSRARGGHAGHASRRSPESRSTSDRSASGRRRPVIISACDYRRVAQLVRAPP